jgi:hypothetical protein
MTNKKTQKSLIFFLFVCMFFILNKFIISEKNVSLIYYEVRFKKYTNIAKVRIRNSKICSIESNSKNHQKIKNAREPPFSSVQFD